jgi:hypothetical protein
MAGRRRDFGFCDFPKVFFFSKIKIITTNRNNNNSIMRLQVKGNFNVHADQTLLNDSHSPNPANGHFQIQFMLQDHVEIDPPLLSLSALVSLSPLL